MTVPSTIILPRKTKLDSLEAVDKYFDELTFELQRMYSSLAQVTNGSIKTESLAQSERWTPILKGTTTPGTFIYTHQVGTVLRKGLWVDCWFDIKWSARGGAAGNLYVELPYSVALSNQKPFVGVLQPSSLAFTAGTNLVINAISNTYRGEIWYTGNAIATGHQTVKASGQLIGHIRYLGESDE